MSGQENHDGRIPTPASSEPKAPHSSDYAPYPKLDPNEATPPPAAPISGDPATTMPPEFNPYVSPSPVPKSELLFSIRFLILSNFSVWLIDWLIDLGLRQIRWTLWRIRLGNGRRWQRTPPRRQKISPETFGSTVSSSSPHLTRLFLLLRRSGEIANLMINLLITVSRKRKIDSLDYVLL